MSREITLLEHALQIQSTSTSERRTLSEIFELLSAFACDDLRNEALQLAMTYRRGGQDTDAVLSRAIEFVELADTERARLISPPPAPKLPRRGRKARNEEA